MGFVKEFKEFATRGNVIDMAVGIIIGGAFGKIVSSLVGDVIMPAVGILIGGVNFTDIAITLKAASVNAAGEAVPAVLLKIGSFMQACFDFFVIALSIFVFIKIINRVTRKKAEEPATATPPAPSKEEVLLTDIRDLLKKQTEK